MRVTILEEAANDLEGIFACVAKENSTAAFELIRRIRERIGRLETPGLSHMGRFGVVIGTRELVEADHIVVYQVNDHRNEIVVLATFHSKQRRN
jgi:plasmid stabilization system protein ParE